MMTTGEKKTVFTRVGDFFETLRRPTKAAESRPKNGGDIFSAANPINANRIAAASATATKDTVTSNTPPAIRMMSGRYLERSIRRILTARPMSEQEEERSIFGLVQRQRSVVNKTEGGEAVVFSAAVDEAVETSRRAVEAVNLHRAEVEVEEVKVEVEGGVSTATLPGMVAGGD